MFLLKIGVPQTCFEIALTWSSSKVVLWIHKVSIRNNLWNKSYSFLMEEWITLLKGTITIGPQARCARHDITLLGHIKTNVITLGNMFQPSYLTEIQIWLVSGYLRLGMPEKKRCNRYWRDENVRSSGKELWKRVPKQEFTIKPRIGWEGGWWTKQQFIGISKRWISTIMWTKR